MIAHLFGNLPSEAKCRCCVVATIDLLDPLRQFVTQPRIGNVLDTIGRCFPAISLVTQTTLPCQSHWPYPCHVVQTWIIGFDVVEKLLIDTSGCGSQVFQCARILFDDVALDADVFDAVEKGWQQLVAVLLGLVVCTSYGGHCGLTNVSCFVVDVATHDHRGILVDV